MRLEIEAFGKGQDEAFRTVGDAAAALLEQPGVRRLLRDIDATRVF
jgi:hypothetical protein